MKYCRKLLCLLLSALLCISLLPALGGTARASIEQATLSVELHTFAADGTELPGAAGGTVSLSKTAVLSSGDEVTLTANLNPGYRLERLIYGGTIIWDATWGPENVVTFRTTASSDADHSLKVWFAAGQADTSQRYDLYIDGIRVCDSNCGDVLGDGVFSYDPARNVLTVDGSYTAEHLDYYCRNIIDNDIPDLTIRVAENGAALYCPDYKYFNLIDSRQDLRITGPGELDLSGSGYYGTGVEMEGAAKLTVENAFIMVHGLSYGFIGDYLGNSSLEVISSRCVMNVWNYAVRGFTGGITLTDTEVSNPQNWQIVGGEIRDADSNTGVDTLELVPDYKLWINGSKVTWYNYTDVLGDGVFSFDPVSATLTLKGRFDDMIQGTLIDSGLPDLTVYVPSEGAEVSIDGTHDNLFFLRCSGNLTVTGPGRLKVTGPGERGAQGIFISYGDLTFDNAMFECSGFLSCVGGRGPALHHTLTVNHSVLSLDALTTENLNGALALFETVNITNCTVTTPENALIQNGTVCNADGTWAQTVRTAVPAYDLTIANVQVDELNKDDVLGNGVFAYDPDENVLYIHGDFSWNVSLCEASRKTMIRSSIPDLTVNVTENSVLTNTSADQSSAQSLLYSNRSMKLTGKGNLTLTAPGVRYGYCIGLYSGSSGSSQYTLTLEDAQVTFLDASGGIEGHAVGRASLVFRNSVARFINMRSSCVNTFYNGVTLEGCALVRPAGAAFTSDGTLQDADGNNVLNAVIRSSGQIGGIYIADVAITDDNCEDVLGDGVFSFDDSTGTLTVRGTSSRIGTGARYLIESDYQGLWIDLEEDAELTNYGGLSEAMLWTATDLTLTGPHTLTLKGGGGQNGILIDGYGSLRLSNTALQTENVEYGLRGGTGNHASLQIDHSLLELDTGSKAVTGFNNGISMNRVVSFVQGAPVTVVNGEIVGQDGTAPASLIVRPYFVARMYASSTAATPVTAEVYYGETVPFRDFEHNGLTVAAWYTDRALTQPFDPETVSGLESPDVELFPSWGYPLWLGETQVTEDNCGDILGDGLASYDPDSKTLTVTGPIDPGVHPVTGLEDQYITSAVIYSEGTGLSVVCSNAALRNENESGAGIVAKDGSLTFYGENAELITSGPAVYAGDRFFHNGSTSIKVGLDRDYGPIFAVHAVNYIQLSGVLNIDCNASYAVWSTQEDLDVYGYLKIRNTCYGGNGLYKNSSNGDINLKPGAVVTIRSEDAAIYCLGDLSIRCNYLDLASTKDEWNDPIALTVYGSITKDADCLIQLPEGGQIQTVNGDQGTYTTVRDAEGNPAARVLIARDYPVWIGETKVTASNCSDVLGDGKVSFDPLTNTLTVRDVLQGSDTGYYAGEYMIFSKDVDLTIDAPNGLIVFTWDHSGVRVSDGDLTVNGNVGYVGESISMMSCKNSQIEVLGRLTVNGSVEFASSDHSGQIYARDGVHITGSFTSYGQPTVADVVSDGDIVIDGGVEIGNPVSSGLRSEGGSVTLNADVTIQAPNGFGVWARETVNVGDGAWDVDSRYGAIVGIQGVGIANYARITLPVNGTVATVPLDGGYWTTVTAPGSSAAAKHVIISEGMRLWVGPVQVCASNCDDILGDGTVSFDPDTGVLTLNSSLYADNCGTFNIGNYNRYALIYAEDMDLILTAPSGTVRLFNTVDTDYREFGVYVDHGSVTVDGDLYGHCGDSTIYVNYGDIRVNGDAEVISTNYHGNHSDWGPAPLYALGVVSVYGNLTAKAHEHACVYGTYGVFVYGDVDLENTCPAGGRGIYGDEVEVDGSLTGVSGESVVYCGDLHITGDVDVTTTMYDSHWVIGKYADYNVYTFGSGIVCENGELDGNVTVNSAGNIGIFASNCLALGLGRIDVTATEAAILAMNTVNFTDDDITLPTGGVVNMVNIPYHGTPTDFYTVTPANSATPAPHVVLERNTLPLWVCGVQVTLDNKDDILGDGKVSFDPDTNTLTLDDRILTDGSWTAGEGYAIYADGMDLSVTDTTGAVRLNPANLSACAKGIWCSGNLNIRCDLTTELSGAVASVTGYEVFVSGDCTDCALKAVEGNVSVYGNYSMHNEDGVFDDFVITGRYITIWGDLEIVTDSEGCVYAGIDFDDDDQGVKVHGDVYLRNTNEDEGWGILSLGDIELEGDVDAACAAACIYANKGDVTIRGETYAVGTTEGPAPAGKYLFPYANGTPIIAARGSVHLLSSATVNAVACVGIFAGDTLYLDGVRFDITASESAVLAKNGVVGPPSAEIVLPANGVIGTVTIYGTDYAAVTESDWTTPALHAVIEDSVFPLWVSGVRVTRQNCANILGDGSAYFDYGTKTLTLSGATITGSYSWSETDEWGYTTDYNAAIYAAPSLGDLRIVASQGLNINNPSGMGIWVRRGSLNIESSGYGGVNVTAVAKDGVIWAADRLNIFGSANLTGTAGYGLGSGAEVLVTGDLTVQGGGGTGVYAGSLEVQGNLNVTNTVGTYSTGVFCNQGGVTVGGNAVVNANYDGIEAYGDVSIAGDATITGTNDCGVLSYEKIRITGGTWDVTGGVSALGAFEGIELSDNHVITLPVGGVIGMAPMSFPDGKYTRQVYAVTESDGTTAATHAIITSQQSYDLWVAGVQVTSANKDDVLNDGGTAVFDPATNTLTLDNLATNQVHSNSVVYSDSMNLTVVPASGSLTLSNTGTSALGFGIRVMNGTLTVQGDLSVSANARCLQATAITVTGDLTLTSERSSGVSLAQASSGDLTVGGDLQVTGPHGAGVTANTVNVGGNVQINLTYTNSAATAISASTGFNAGGNVVIYTSGNTINCSSGAVHIDGYAMLFSTGSVAGTYSLTAKNGIYVGDYLIASATTSSMVAAATVYSSDGDITVRGSMNVQNNCDSYGNGVYARLGKVEVMGTATVSSAGPGIRAGGDVKIYYGAEVTSTGGVGIWAGGKAIVMDGTWDVTGGACAIAAVQGIELTGAHVIDLPVNGELANLSCEVITGENPVTAWTVAEPGGTTPAAHAIIRQRLNTGFYLIGPNGWDLADVNEADFFVENPNAAGEYMLQTTLTAGEPIKVVAVQGGFIAGWFPEGTGNEYVVDAAHAGNVTIYFRTEYQSGWAQFGGYIWIEAQPASQPMLLEFQNTLALDGATTLNYFVKKSGLDAYELDSFKLVVSHTAFVDGAYVEELVELEAKDELYANGQYYWFEYKDIAAKELNDHMIAYVEGTKNNVTYQSQGRDYNPITYCYTIAQRPTSNAALRKTCADMIKYAAAAQECFSYNTANLADANWNDDIAAVATQGDPVLASYKESIPLAGQTAEILTYTLDASGRVNINYYVLPDNLNDYENLTLVCTYKDVKGNDVTAEIPGTDWSFFNATYGYMATLNTVNAGEMREIITAVVKDANGNVISNTYKTSIETYAKTIVDRNNNPALIKLMKAMLNYGTSAQAFLS